MNNHFETLINQNNAEAVVGIPYRDESDTILDVVTTARKGLEEAGLGGRAAVLCIGSKNAVCRPILKKIFTSEDSKEQIPVIDVQLKSDFMGRGAGIWKLMEASLKLGCPLIVLSPDLLRAGKTKNRPGQGYSPSWIKDLLMPIHKSDCDLALARFNRGPLTHSVESLVVSPIVAAVWGFNLRQPIPDVFAFSVKLLRSCLSSNNRLSSELGDFGFNPWIVTHAITNNLRICEVPLGLVRFQHDTGKLKLVFRQVVQVLLSQVKNTAKWWKSRPDLISSPHRSGSYPDIPPVGPSFDRDELLSRFKCEFDHFDDTLFRKVVADDLRVEMEQLADKNITGVRLDAGNWVRILSDFIIAYGFETEFHPDDIVDGLYPFFLARLASLNHEIKSLGRDIGSAKAMSEKKIDGIVRREAEQLIERQAELFVLEWPKIRDKWKDKESSTESYLPRLGAWEFVPQVGLVLPQEIKGAKGEIVFANNVYQELIDRYRGQFKTFVQERLDLEEVADSSEILNRVRRFMRKLDWALDVDLFGVDLQTVGGAGEMVTQICREFAKKEAFQLKKDVIRSILKRTPPSNLIMQTGCRNVTGLLDKFDPNDILGLASWTDRQHYLENVLDILQRDARPDWFESAPPAPVVVDLNYMTNASEVRGTAALARLAGRVVVGNYDKGWGGEFQKLWFFLKAIKSIMGVELFSEVWQGFALQKTDFKERLVSSIKGHWGRRVLSAHNAFENRHQRILAQRLKEFAQHLKENRPDKVETAELIKAAAEVYHLSITLPDATFVPFSAWTWASYSHRGGLNTPTPLSSLVERDWSTRDFLTAYLERAGIGNEKTIDDKIAELIGQGRESEDLSHHLLGVHTDPDELVVTQSLTSDIPQAGKLKRPVKGPILEPIPEHSWESRYVLNAAAVRIKGVIYILYRAFGEEQISRIGLAWTKDGIHIDGRLDKPIFEPAHATESAGCEDPRVCIIGDRLYMLYTAWDGKLHQIAMASIPIRSFVKHRFDAWHRHGLGFPGLPNKDAVLYPEKFNGKHVIYHRLDPNMWITYMDSIECPWPRSGAKIVVGPRPGMMWDGVKIGAGAQPIKTTHGWLNIYHGVDYERSYRLGVLFMDLNDPSKVLYQSPGPILEPETDFEIGNFEGRDFWVPRVVFTCGAVPTSDKEVIGPEDEILVYYGAADTAIGVATAKLGELVPIL